MSDAIELADVSVFRGSQPILHNINWRIREGERWVVLGPNGAGKTTLLDILSTNIFPTQGMVSLLGEMLGLVDVFELRPRIGVSSALMTGRIPDDEKVLDVVRTSSFGMTASGRESYEIEDNQRALQLLQQWGVGELVDRVFGTLSEGERKRVLIARSLMTNPELLLLDEPAAGLDIKARETLIQTLSELSENPLAPVTVLVTHHVEEIPTGATHVLLMSHGKVVAQGEIDAVLTSELLERAFELPLELIVRQTSAGRRYTLTPR
jgi:iron complex transport system ATP-binding protein